MRAVNSSTRSPAKTRWVCESTKPGTTHRPAASSIESAAGDAPLSPIQATTPPSMTRSTSCRSPSAPCPSSGRFVRSVPMSRTSSEPTGPIMALRPASRRLAKASCIDRTGSSTSWWRPAATTWRPATTTSVTSAPVAAKTREATTASGPGPRQARGVKPDGHEIRQGAGSEAARLRPAERPVARQRDGLEECFGRMHATAEAHETLVELDAARLFEQIHDGVAVRADAQRAACLCEGARRADPVGEVAFGRRAHADRRGFAIRGAGRPRARDGWRGPRSSAARERPRHRGRGPACGRRWPDSPRSRQAARKRAHAREPRDLAPRRRPARWRPRRRPGRCARRRRSA